MNKIKVLHIHWIGHTGGAERFLRDIMQFFDKDKFEHAICFLAESGLLKEYCIKFGIPHYSLHMKSGLSLIAGVKLLKILNEFNPDIVHVHTRNYFINILFMLHPRIKRMYSEHGGSFEPSQDPKEVERYKNFYRTFIKHYQRVLTNAEYLRSKILEWTGLSADKVKIYNYGIETVRYGNCSQRETFRKSWNVPHGHKVVGIVGRLVEQKGIDDFIRICHEINCLDQTLFYIIVGDGPLRQTLENLSRELQVKIVFLGDRQDLPALLTTFDVFVFTSKWEPFGIIILETLASGVPVVGFKIPGMQAIIEKGGGAVLVDNRDHKRTAQEVISLLNDPQKYDLLVKEGRSNVENNFEVKRNISLLEKEYCDILGAHFKSF